MPDGPDVLNPKTALFFVAFLPQFVDRSVSVPVQMAFFGLLFVVLGIVSGGMYLTLGVTAALSGSRASD